MVCNAAVNPVYGPLSELPDEAFDKVMGSNVKSNIWLANLVAPQMAAQGGGSIIIVSSIGGIRGTDVLGIYGISKAADFALARNLAVEWGPKNVRANCIAPGLVKTDFAQGACGKIRNISRSAREPARCAASANPTRSAASSRFWRRRPRAS